ncbi:MAG: cytochrome c oxidase subunit 3 [Deltaproteobacteria bacterium]|nr:cytochrome c oxidase subunit 3 [Deltaproteobacteria bacterium]MBI3293160.1 cytochrome c oxidase subunit 3 [Deltaproteobacteria bacterium]
MIVIPYVDKPHPLTGVTNAKFGIWLFLASEVMLFGALFSTLIILRTGSANWPLGSTELNVPLATINTIALITSSVTIVLAWASLKMQQIGRFRVYMALTLLLSAVFLVIKYFEYTHKFEHGHFPSTSTFFAIYFTMTGLHGIHIIGGMIVNAYLMGPGSAMWKKNPEQFTGRVECAGLYWHFVDLVWIFLFPSFYLL